MYQVTMLYMVYVICKLCMICKVHMICEIDCKVHIILGDYYCKVNMTCKIHMLGVTYISCRQYVQGTHNLERPHDMKAVLDM